MKDKRVLDYTNKSERECFDLWFAECPVNYEATTDNFEKWLEEHNSRREEDFQEDADDFEVEEISLYLYDADLSQFQGRI